MNKIKAVIFDIGGVLEVGKDPRTGQGTRTLGVHEEISKKLKISLDQWFDAIDSTYSEAVLGEISKEKALSIIANNVKTTSKRIESLLKHAYKNHYHHNKKLYEFAFRLKKQGYKIAILSDQWQVAKEVLMLKRYTEKFHVVVVSCDVGLRKPDSKIYKLVLKKLKLNPKEAAFIDNQVWNVKPAEKIGIKAILYKNNKQTIKDLKNLGVEI